MAINKPTVGQLGRMVESLKTDVQNTNRYISDIWRVIKLTNDNADALKKRVDALEQRNPVEVSVKADEKSLTAYVHRLETLINDIEKGLSNRLDVYWLDFEDLENRINELGTTQPAVDPERFEKLETLFDDQRVKLWARIDDIDRYFTNRLDEVEQIAGSTSYDHSTTEYMQKELTERVERLERAAVFATEDPRPQRDTSWHPYDALDHESVRDQPMPNERVVVMLRRSDVILPPCQAEDRNWDEQGDSTVVAWRYAKEGE